MADPVHRALRRKYEAAKAVGDVARIKVLRGLLGLPAEAPVAAPAEVAPVVPATDEATWHYVEQDVAGDGTTRIWVDGVEVNTETGDE